MTDALSAIRLEGVLAGRINAPLSANDARPSAIGKTPVVGRVHVGLEGLESDEQADRTVHGGPEKALHHYPHDHYEGWRQELDGEVARACLEQRGAFGENISTTGWTETSVCLGDVIAIGSTVRIQVSHGRQPCTKLNARFDCDDMVRRVLTSGRTGWYYRVLEVGSIDVGDEMRLIERPAPTWSLARVFRALFLEARGHPDLGWLSETPLLAPTWSRRARARRDARDSSS